MVEQISNQPALLNLSLYAGDGVAFKLICTADDDTSIPITGDINSQIRIDRLTTEILVEFAADLTEASEGVILLSLAGEQTQQLIAAGKKGKFSGVWDVQWTPIGAEPRTICQGDVVCLADVTRLNGSGP